MSPEVKRGKCIGDALASRLLTIARPQTSRSLETRRSTPEVRNQKADLRPKPGSVEIGEPIFIATVGAKGVVDTGASRTVVGSDRVKRILSSLSRECQKNVRKVRSKATFRFGNSGTLDSKWALLIPTSEGAWIRVEVVNGSTPLLISNRLLRELDAIIHVRKGQIQVPGGVVQMRCDQRGLSIVDFAELMQHVTAPAAAVHFTSVSSTEDPQHSQQPPAPADQSQQSSATKTAQPKSDSAPQLRTLRRGGHPSGGHRGPERVPGGQVHPAAGSDHDGSLGQDHLERWQAQRERSLNRLCPGPRLCHAELPELCPRQTSQGSKDSGEPVERQGDQNAGPDREGGRLGADLRGANGTQDSDRPEAHHQGQGHHQELAQRRALLLRELGQIDKLEKQAQQQSKQHPEKPETEG